MNAILLSLLLGSSSSPAKVVEVKTTTHFAGRLGMRVEQTLKVLSGGSEVTIHVSPYHTRNSGQHAFESGQTVEVKGLRTGIDHLDVSISDVKVVS